MNDLFLNFRSSPYARRIPALAGFLMAVYMTHFCKDIPYLRQSLANHEPAGMLASALILISISLVSVGILKLNLWALGISFFFCFLLVGLASILTGLDNAKGASPSTESVFFAVFGILWVLYWALFFLAGWVSTHTGRRPNERF